MEIIAFLIPLSLAFVALGLWIFFRAVDGEQFENLNMEGERPLLDEDETSDSQNPR